MPTCPKCGHRWESHPASVIRQMIKTKEITTLKELIRKHKKEALKLISRQGGANQPANNNQP